MNKRLRTLIGNGHIPHAIVIDGGTYDERLALAYTLSSALICESDGTKPCGNCLICKKVQSRIHPDVITVLPEDGKKNLSVKTVRAMRENAFIVPNEAEKKIYIIAKSETMQEEAQNALLKILEEPPKNVMFILLCPTHSFLLDTVLSRVAVFTLDDDQGTTGTADENTLQFVSSLCEALVKHDEAALLKATAYLEKNYEILPDALDCFELIIRDALAISLGSTETVGPAIQLSRELASAYGNNKLLKLQEASSKIVQAIDIYSNKNLTITRLASLLASAGGNT